MKQVSDTVAIGELIHEERKRQGYNQATLARYAGVGINFISQLENGKETAEIGKVIRVLQTLGIDLFAERRGA